MVRFLILFLLTFNALASYIPPGVPQNNLAQGVNTATPGIVMPPSGMSNLVTLITGYDASTLNNYYRLVSMGAQGTSQENYRVPTGKTLYCSGFYASWGATNGNAFGYADTAVTNNSGTAPTNPKLFCNDTLGCTELQGSSPDYKFIPFPMQFPADKYPFIWHLTGSSVQTRMILVCQLL